MLTLNVFTHPLIFFENIIKHLTCLLKPALIISHSFLDGTGFCQSMAHLSGKGLSILSF